ncbi:MAG: hypothetical protein QOC71_1773 [Thermoplasmata archaeon]|nr:hypothetical protein [Thermoplasmata archaeon]
MACPSPLDDEADCGAKETTALWSADRSAVAIAQPEMLVDWAVTVTVELVASAWAEAIPELADELEDEAFVALAMGMAFGLTTTVAPCVWE